MQKSEPILIGDLLRQMFSDTRIKALIDDYGMMGLGTYIYLCNTIDAQSPGGLPLDYVIKSASSHASRNRIRNVLRNYSLFTEDEFGLIRVCELAPDHGIPTHGTPTHGTHTDGIHEHTEEEKNNINNKLSMTDKCVKIKRRFQKPTVEEVDAYCRQRQNHVDATRFCNFYESKGWMVGKTKMVDWKAAVRTWERGNNVNLNHDLNSNLDLNLDLNPVTTSGRYLPCTIQKIDPIVTQPSRSNAVIVQSKMGTKYEKAIDWSNFQTCWIDLESRPILHDYIHRWDKRDLFD